MPTTSHKRYRACEADKLGLGWRVGFTYFSGYWRKADVVLGYNVDGSVIVRDTVTFVERTHCTPINSQFEELVADIPNIFGWTAATTRTQREKVTVTS